MTGRPAVPSDSGPWHPGRRWPLVVDPDLVALADGPTGLKYDLVLADPQGERGIRVARVVVQAAVPQRQSVGTAVRSPLEKVVVQHRRRAVARLRLGQRYYGADFDHLAGGERPPG